MKSMYHSFAAVAALVFGASTVVALADNAAVNSSDKSFLTDAYQDGLAEINAAQLGQSKSANADIKAFSDHIAADHAKANADLKTLADSKKVGLPADASLVEQAKGKLLDARSGDGFDKAFVEAMVSDHKKAVAAFEKAANEAQDPDVKAFAAKVLPALKMHLSMAEDLQNKIGK
jgi:putative membrane protein